MKKVILKYLGENHFTSYHYFNFEKGGKLHQIFDKDLDPSRILGELSLLQERAIDKEDLIIFDEIQNCPRPSQA
jgi:predicted AAA+ superfamily ATPase